MIVPLAAYIVTYNRLHDAAGHVAAAAGAVDFNIPLITNARLATAFVRAFCSMTMDQVSVKTAGEY